MAMTPKEVPVFKSSEPDAYARATVLLKSAGIPFRGVDQHVGSLRLPRRVHWILVPENHVETAAQAITSVPSEILMSPQEQPISTASRTIAWTQIITLAVLALFWLIMVLVTD